uniref:Uncharacterized protein n=1 Tax=Arundo donax TaxID=35708 RepID=A0A0A9G6P8_ARUDO
MNFSLPSLWLRPTTISLMRRHRAMDPVELLFLGGRGEDDAGEEELEPGVHRQ